MSSVVRKESSLFVQVRVIRALILRDIRTRFFGNGLGYVVAILWPLVHMGVLLTVYMLAGRIAPFGESPLQFFAIALVPVISFSYMSRWIMQSVSLNKPLLNFPIVKFLDIILARALLEAACACCVALLLATILFALDVPIMPRDGPQAAAAFLSALLLGMGVGAINGVIVLKLPIWSIVYVFVWILLYATSGVIFMPEALPEEIRYVLSWNPLMHAVEWMRQSFYLGYRSVVLDKTYLLGAGLIFLFSALAVERGLRQFLSRR